MLRLFIIAAFLCPDIAVAEDLEVCFNYGCAAQAPVRFSDFQLAQVGSLFGGVETAQAERVAIAQAVGWMYHYAGHQSPIWRDRGGNLEDEHFNGRMDCIDHSTNSTRFLDLLARRGMLKFHRVLAPVKREYIFTMHMAAQIAERADGGTGGEAGAAANTRVAAVSVFAVDSWFFDPGYPAEVYPLAEWLGGRRPEGL